MPEMSTSNEQQTSQYRTLIQKEGFVVRPYQSGDGPAINRGFNEIFAQQRSIEEWSWKFQPEAGDCWITVAIDSNRELIAHFGVVRHWVQVFGHVHCAGQAMDVYRLKRAGTAEQRVFTETTQHFYNSYGRPDKISFLFGFPGTRHMEMGRDRLGYAAPVPVPVWRRAAGTKRLWWQKFSINHECAPSELDDLWARSAHRYPVSVVRDGARLVRRYLSRPGHDYIQLVSKKNGIVSAWAVLKQRNNEVLEWIDLLWDGADPEALIALDDAANGIAKSKRAQRLEMWLAQDPQAARVFEKRGWILGEHPEKLQLTSISFNPDIDESRLLSSFYITMGDSDLV